MLEEDVMILRIAKIVVMKMIVKILILIINLIVKRFHQMQTMQNEPMWKSIYQLYLSIKLMNYICNLQVEF